MDTLRHLRELAADCSPEEPGALEQVEAAYQDALTEKSPTDLAALRAQGEAAVVAWLQQVEDLAQCWIDDVMNGDVEVDEDEEETPIFTEGQHVTEAGRVVATGTAHVVARGTATVEAFDSAHVEVFDDAQVEAYQNDPTARIVIHGEATALLSRYWRGQVEVAR